MGEDEILTQQKELQTDFVSSCVDIAEYNFVYNYRMWLFLDCTEMSFYIKNAAPLMSFLILCSHYHQILL